METALVSKTLRVPTVAASPRSADEADGSVVARQMDAVLMEAGFKASGALMRHLSLLPAGAAMDRAIVAIGAVRKLVGDHVDHNVYFVGFPHNVPDTVEFWLSLVRRTVIGSGDVVGRAGQRYAELSTWPEAGRSNLLDLPGYGSYQHTYAEMLEAHDELIAAAGDRVTLLDLGGSLEEEQRRLYLELAGSAVSLPDTALLAELAGACLDAQQPPVVPVREHRAVINAVRVAAAREPIGVDSVTDVLRLACRMCGGDETLARPTRFSSLPRARRRALMAALDAVVAADPARLGDIGRHREPWKRLGEYLHPEEVDADRRHVYRRFPHARDVFRVARGERRAPSLAGSVEQALAARRVGDAIGLLSLAPGRLARSLDHVLRVAGDERAGEVVTAFGKVAGRVSGRVLLSLWEHVLNRQRPGVPRMFVNRTGRAWVTPDRRALLGEGPVDEIVAIVRDEIASRLPEIETLVIDPDVLPVALPLSGNGTEEGFGVMPRGSRFRVDGDVLRLFTYWRQRQERTDFDLSALFLDADFRELGKVSFTGYHYGRATHSGDVTRAHDGATELIDVPLVDLPASYVVPQVNIYTGEGFDEVAEAMAGVMVRDAEQAGRPFEARTVRVRSALRGRGRVVLPFVLGRDRTGAWFGKWMHLYLRGEPAFNRIETNRLTTALSARAIVQRRYLTVSALVAMLTMKATSVFVQGEGLPSGGPVTYVGLSAPEGLPEGSTVITLASLTRLIPE